MWVTPLLSQLNEPVIRTLSFQIELIPRARLGVRHAAMSLMTGRRLLRRRKRGAVR